MKETDDEGKIQGDVDPVTCWEGEKEREREGGQKGRQGEARVRLSRIPILLRAPTAKRNIF